MASFSDILSRTPERTPNRPQTGGGLVQEAGPINAGLSPSVGPSGTVAGEFQNPFQDVLGGSSSFVDQFLNPSLVAEQQRAIDAIRKTAAAKGLSGGAVDFQVQQAQERLLAGNRVNAVQGLRGETRGRLDAFQQQISPFLKASRGSVGKGGKSGLSQQLPQLEGSLFGGLTSLGLEDFIKGEAFRRTGGEGGRQNTFNPGGPFQGALDQLFRPGSGGFQAEGAAAGQLGRFFEDSLDTLEDEALGLDVFGEGAGFLGEFDPGAVLGADVSQFAGLFQALGFGGGSPSDLLQG